MSENFNAELNDSLASNYLLVSMSFRAWGGERINHKVTDEVVQSKQATHDAGIFRMKLLASADTELKAVRAQIVALRAFAHSRTLAWTMSTEGAKKGDRLISTAESMQFLGDVSRQKKGLDGSVLDLQAVWDERVAQAIANLAGMATAADYPSAADIPSLFNVTIGLRPMPTVADFTRLSIPVPLATALGQRLANQTKAQVENAMNDLRDRLVEEIQRMVGQLSKAGAGEKTKLYESMLTNTGSLCALARNMNLTGSQRFNDLLDRIENDLLHYPITTLREDKATAAMVADNARQVLSNIHEIEWF